MQRRVVHFSGNVQGVGFRFTAIRLAGNFDVTGYVRNLPDGRVECVAEGTAEEIDAFLDELAKVMSGYIRQQTQQLGDYTGNFDGFGVRY